MILISPEPGEEVKSPGCDRLFCLFKKSRIFAMRTGKVEHAQMSDMNKVQFVEAGAFDANIMIIEARKAIHAAIRMTAQLLQEGKNGRFGDWVPFWPSGNRQARAASAGRSRL